METWQVRPTDGEQTLNTAAASERGSSEWHISLALTSYSTKDELSCFVDVFDWTAVDVATGEANCNIKTSGLQHNICTHQYNKYEEK